MATNCGNKWNKNERVVCFLVTLQSFWNLTSQPEIKPALSAVRTQSPNHQTPREFPKSCFEGKKICEIFRAKKCHVLDFTGSPKVQFNSVPQLCPTLCDPMDCNTPGLPVHHQLPRIYPNSCPLSQWCHPTISSSVVPFSSCLQSFPASGSFQMSQLFASGGQSIEVSASTLVLPMNTQDWSPFGWTGWISLQSKGLSRVFSNTTVQKHQDAVIPLQEAQAQSLVGKVLHAASVWSKKKKGITFCFHWNLLKILCQIRWRTVIYWKIAHSPLHPTPTPRGEAPLPLTGNSK